jgi:hypothetical protein
MENSAPLSLSSFAMFSKASVSLFAFRSQDAITCVNSADAVPCQPCATRSSMTLRSFDRSPLTSALVPRTRVAP